MPLTTRRFLVLCVGLAFLGCGSGEEKVAGRTSAQWLNRLSSDDIAERDKTAHALGSAGAKAIPVISQALKSDNSNANIGGVIALWVVGAPAVPEIIKALDHPNPEVRCKAAQALGAIGISADSSVPTLIKRIHDNEPLVRKHAIEAVTKMGTRAKQAVDALVAVVQSSTDVELRVCAARALGDIGPDAYAAVSVLNVVAREPDPLRTAALTALNRITK
jgi:HEAT repeat protein